MDNSLLHVSPSPHVRSKVTTQSIMFYVILALVPATVMGVLGFGLRALWVIMLSVASCVATEALYQHFMHKPITIKDGSAILTGLLLALNLPASSPWFLPVLGGVFAILIVKQLFGGLGQNIMNPALAARCFLLISFASPMTDFTYRNGFLKAADTVSSATPLAAIKAGESADITSLLFLNVGGTIGEVSAVALLVGAVFLLVTKIINLRIPVACIGTFSILVLVYNLATGNGFDLSFLVSHLFAGGLMLGLWFMATDYVTAPITPKGQIVYGCCIGLFTWMFRFFGSSAEGVSFAIIFCNLLVPLIERVTRPIAFGKGGVRS